MDPAATIRQIKDLCEDQTLSEDDRKIELDEILWNLFDWLDRGGFCPVMFGHLARKNYFINRAGTLSLIMLETGEWVFQRRAVRGELSRRWNFPKE
jgi:hypothetical protein